MSIKSFPKRKNSIKQDWKNIFLYDLKYKRKKYGKSRNNL
jgi:hypothetical protein